MRRTAQSLRMEFLLWFIRNSMRGLQYPTCCGTLCTTNFGQFAQLLPPSTLRLTPVVVENEAAPRAVRQKTPKWRARRNQVKAEENRVRVRAKKKVAVA